MQAYFDNSATTKPYNEVVEAMSDVAMNYYGNPSSLHKKGIEAENLLKNARMQIADSFGVEAEEIYFTSGGTEANNTAIFGYAYANMRKGKHIITTKIEHPSVLEAVKRLNSEGFEVEYLDVNRYGKIDAERLANKVREDTILVSIVYVNNEIGTVQPISEICEKVKFLNKDAVVHIDAVQAYGKIDIKPKKMGVDLLSISSHKIHGPKGVGALFAKKGLRLKPLQIGGGQENQLRSGTENVPGIVGFAKASSIICKEIDNNYKKVSDLKDCFIEELAKHCLDFTINSPCDALPYILNISFPYIKAEVLLHHLEDKDIYVSTGSACASRKNRRSHVLSALGLDGKTIDGSIRVSFSSQNTLEQVQYAVRNISEVIGLIRR